MLVNKTLILEKKNDKAVTLSPRYNMYELNTFKAPLYDNGQECYQGSEVVIIRGRVKVDGRKRYLSTVDYLNAFVKAGIIKVDDPCDMFPTVTWVNKDNVINTVPREEVMQCYTNHDKETYNKLYNLIESYFD